MNLKDCEIPEIFPDFIRIRFSFIWIVSIQPHFRYISSNPQVILKQMWQDFEVYCWKKLTTQNFHNNLSSTFMHYLTQIRLEFKWNVGMKEGKKRRTIFYWTSFVVIPTAPPPSLSCPCAKDGTQSSPFENWTRLVKLSIAKDAITPSTPTKSSQNVILT